MALRLTTTEKQGIEDDAGRHARRNNQAPVW
jgi:hypothetical protein